MAKVSGFILCLVTFFKPLLNPAPTVEMKSLASKSRVFPILLEPRIAIEDRASTPETEAGFYGSKREILRPKSYFIRHSLATT